MKARINDIEIDYEESGSGPAVFFLHDYATNRQVPAAQIKCLTAAGYRVISTDLSGLGKPGDNFDAVSRARNAVALFNYLGIGRAVVFGLSRGGLVLLELMEHFPARVAAGSLVLSPEALREIRRLANRPEMRQALRAGKVEALKNALTLSLTGKSGEKRTVAALAPLRKLIESLCRRKGTGELFASLAIPAITMTEEGPEALPGKRSIASRGWQKIKGINAHLAAVLDFLLPGDDNDEEEEILTVRA